MNNLSNLVVYNDGELELNEIVIFIGEIVQSALLIKNAVKS